MMPRCFTSRVRTLVGCLFTLFISVGLCVATPNEGFAQFDLSPPNKARAEYEAILAKAREHRDIGDFSEALSRYDSAYRKGLEVAREGGFGSRKMVIPIDIRRGKTMEMMVPRGKEELDPLILEAARVAVLADQPQVVLYWLRVEGMYHIPLPSDAIFPAELGAQSRLQHHRLVLLDELIDLAKARGREHTLGVLEAEKERHARIREFEQRYWREQARKARIQWFIVLTIGLAVILGLIMWFSWPSLILPKIRWVNKPHKIYRRYVPREPPGFRTFFHISRQKITAEKTTAFISGTLVVFFCSGVGFFLAGLFMHNLWERPQKEPIIHIAMIWLFGGLGLFMFVLLFFDRKGIPSIDPLGKFIVASRSENLLATYEEMQRERVAICQHYKIPGLFTRWRSMEEATINLMGALSGRGVAPRALVGLFIADHLRRSYHVVPAQVELWLRDGLNNGLLVYFEEAVDDYMQMLPVAERRRWYKDFPILEHRLDPEIESGTPDMERIEEELTVALRTGRRWTVERWRERFLRGGLYAGLRHQMVWGAYDRDGALLQTFRVEDEMTFVDAEMEEIDLESSRLATDQIGIAHPGEWSKTERMTWAEHLADFEVIMACDQLSREPVEVAPERETLALGFTVNGEKIKKLWQDGWQQPYGATYFERTFPFYGCKVRVEPDRGEVSFFDSRAPSIVIPADRIHPVALSEIVHTLRLIDGLE